MKDFIKDFNIDYLPEPYLVFKEGKRELFVLNNNPGHILENQVQARETIKSKYPGKCYAEVAEGMTDYYRGSEFAANEPIAYRRNDRMFDFAHKIRCDGMVNVETFFLHSASFNKQKFLNEYKGSELAKEYTEKLKKFLADKDVLAISGSGPIDPDNLKLSEWAEYQCDIIGLDISKAELIPIRRSEKGGNVSTAIIHSGRKFMTLMRGSNFLPDIPDSIFVKLSINND